MAAERLGDLCRSIGKSTFKTVKIVDSKSARNPIRTKQSSVAATKDLCFITAYAPFDMNIIEPRERMKISR